MIIMGTTYIKTKLTHSKTIYNKYTVRRWDQPVLKPDNDIYFQKDLHRRDWFHRTAVKTINDICKFMVETTDKAIFT